MPVRDAVDQGKMPDNESLKRATVVALQVLTQEF